MRATYGITPWAQHVSGLRVLLAWGIMLMLASALCLAYEAFAASDWCWNFVMDFFIGAWDFSPFRGSTFGFVIPLDPWVTITLTSEHPCFVLGVESPIDSNVGCLPLGEV